MKFVDAIHILQQEGTTFAAILPEEKTFPVPDKETPGSYITVTSNIYTSDKKGIAPVMDRMKEDYHFFQGAIVADRVIGKAAAMLLISSGAAKIYGEMTSEHSFAVLEAAKTIHPEFEYSIGEVVPYIINRAGTDMCPMEKTVLNLEPEKVDSAFKPLKKKLEEMA
ncbi:MAG: DUF1893 domain-containing protein [Lachnospiraceae bacterium]|nr:DUF1893 domain-containing protein [Lachnospiraceae bacterium]